MLVTAALLPLEIWGEILSWLDLEDLEACDIASKEWHLAELSIKSIRRVSFEDGYYIEEERLSKMVNLELLESNSLSPLVCLDKLTKLRTLSLGYGAKVPNDLRGMRNLVSLSVSTYCCLEEDLQLPLSEKP